MTRSTALSSLLTLKIVPCLFPLSHQTSRTTGFPPLPISRAYSLLTITAIISENWEHLFFFLISVSAVELYDCSKKQSEHTQSSGVELVIPCTVEKLMWVSSCNSAALLLCWYLQQHCTV